jgi:hypothetical protein
MSAARQRLAGAKAEVRAAVQISADDAETFF